MHPSSSGKRGRIARSGRTAAPSRNRHVSFADLSSPSSMGHSPLFFPGSQYAAGPSQDPANPPLPDYLRAKQRKLIVCIDGTKQKFGLKNSNVVELYSRIVKSDEQLTYYASGVGTFAKNTRYWPHQYLNKRLRSIFDLMFAWNLEEDVLAAYRWLSDSYQDGDQIFLFGFSRGAYQVRVLAGMIEKVGLILKGNETQIPFAFELYADLNKLRQRHLRGTRSERAKSTEPLYSELPPSVPVSYSSQMPEGGYQGNILQPGAIPSNVSTTGYYPQNPNSPYPQSAYHPQNPGTYVASSYPQPAHHSQNLNSPYPQPAHYPLTSQPYPLNAPLSTQPPQEYVPSGYPVDSFSPTVVFPTTNPRESGFEGNNELAAQFKETFSRPDVKIRFVGVWDTVSSVGVSRSRTLPLTDSCDHIGAFRQALALDERRVKFLPEYALGGATAGYEHKSPSTQLPHVKEVWFAGSHSDIGGGSRTKVDLELAAVPLQWMANEATMAGLNLKVSKAERGWWDWRYLKERQPTNSLKNWGILEYLPITRLNYKGQDSETSGPHIGQGRTILPGQKIHASLAFAKTTYKPAAILPENDDFKWEMLIGKGDMKTFGQHSDLTHIVEMDLFDYASAPQLLEMLETNHDNPHLIKRLAFMTRLEWAARAICDIVYKELGNNDRAASILAKLLQIQANPELQCDAANVIASFLDDSRFRETILSTNANITLADMLKKRSQRHRVSASRAIASLAFYDNSRPFVSEVPEAMYSLLGLIRSSSRSDNLDLETHRHAASALSDLCSDAQCRESVFRESRILRMLQAIDEHEGYLIVRNGAYLLNEFLDYEDTRQKVMRFGVKLIDIISSFVRMLDHKDGNVKFWGAVSICGLAHFGGPLDSQLAAQARWPEARETLKGLGKNHEWFARREKKVSRAVWVSDLYHALPLLARSMSHGHEIYPYAQYPASQDTPARHAMHGRPTTPYRGSGPYTTPTPGEFGLPAGISPAQGPPGVSDPLSPWYHSRMSNQYDRPMMSFGGSQPYTTPAPGDLPAGFFPTQRPPGGPIPVYIPLASGNGSILLAFHGLTPTTTEPVTLDNILTHRETRRMPDVNLTHVAAKTYEPAVIPPDFSLPPGFVPFVGLPPDSPASSRDSSLEPSRPLNADRHVSPHSQEALRYPHGSIPAAPIVQDAPPFVRPSSPRNTGQPSNSIPGEDQVPETSTQPLSPQSPQGSELSNELGLDQPAESGLPRVRGEPRGAALKTLAKVERFVVIGISCGRLSDIRADSTIIAEGLAKKMALAMEDHLVQQGAKLIKLTKIILMTSGTIHSQMEQLWQKYSSNQEWVDELRQADCILLATHHQGGIVSTHFLVQLINKGHIRTQENLNSAATGRPCNDTSLSAAPQLVGCLVMSGAHLGLYLTDGVTDETRSLMGDNSIPSTLPDGLPIILHPNRPSSPPGSVRKHARDSTSPVTQELRDLQDPQSDISLAYSKSLGSTLKHGIKFTYVADIKDPMVPIYSASFTTADHPLILRALCIDDDIVRSTTNPSRFLQNLLVLLFRIRHAGVDDRGLITYLSKTITEAITPIDFSLTHVRWAGYDLAVQFLFSRVESSLASEDLKFQTFVGRDANDSDKIPSALRVVLTDPQVVAHFSSEFKQLRTAFDDWDPSRDIDDEAPKRVALRGNLGPVITDCLTF